MASAALGAPENPACSALQLEGRRTINLVVSMTCSYTWLDAHTIIAGVVPPGLGPAPSKPALPLGPKIEDNSSGKRSQARTFQDLLQVRHAGCQACHQPLCAPAGAPTRLTCRPSCRASTMNNFSSTFAARSLSQSR